MLINNFLKHLRPTYLPEWKEYCHKRGNLTCLKLTILIKFLILTWTKKGSFLDICDTTKIFTWTTKIKSCYKLLKLNKGGIFEILKYIFHLHCEYIHNYTWTWNYFLGAYTTMRVLVKLLSVYKSLAYINIYSLFHSIFSSLWLSYNYNFLKFIQSNNTYFWHHIRWIYAMLFSAGYPFLHRHR